MTDQTEQPQAAAVPPPWTGDHTALVHVLWSARAEGLRLEDADGLARFIRRSQYQWAVQELAAGGAPAVHFQGDPGEHVFLGEVERARIAAARAEEDREVDAQIRRIADRYLARRAVETALIDLRDWLRQRASGRRPGGRSTPSSSAQG